MEKRFWIYIMADKPYGTIYTGITNNLQRRVYEHREGLVEGFTKKHGLKTLVYYEEYPTAEGAIQREKRVKKWNREWKIHNLIHVQNRTWRDLADDFNK